MRINKSAAATVAIIAAAGMLSYSLPKGQATPIATEGQVFVAKSTNYVRYGVEPQWSTYRLIAAGNTGTCSVAFFDNIDPAPGKTKHCERVSGPALQTFGPGTPTIHNVGVAVADRALWPTGLPTGTNQVAMHYDGVIPSAAASTDWEGAGDFRSHCNMSKFGFYDPIVLPGQPDASHLHTFYNNTAIDAFSTTTDVRTRNNPRGNCNGGTVNLSGYWVPSVLDLTQAGNTKGVPIEATLLIYYKTAIWRYIGVTGVTGGTVTGGIVHGGTKNAPPPMTALPLGLRMVTGVATASLPGNPISFTCHFRELDYNINNDLNTGAPYDGSYLPTWCPQKAPAPNNPVGDPLHQLDIWNFVSFRQCWNGQLDSPNHRDHLADTIGGATGPDGSIDQDRYYKCPTGYPFILTHVSLIPDIPIPAHGAGNYILSADAYAIDPATKQAYPVSTKKRGYSSHGDWFNGWDQTIINRWHQHCQTELERRNCGTFTTGDGWQADGVQGSDGVHHGTP